MKIAFIVFEFPRLSESFILNQIVGFLNMGHDVKIYAEYRSKEKKEHPDVAKYRLYERVIFSNPPQNKVKRILKASYLMLTNFHKGPIKIIKSLNVFRYGKLALSLRLFYRLITFLEEDFDIIHCHFGPNGILGVYLKEMGIEGKIVTTFHGFDMSSLISDQGKSIYKDLFLKGDLFLPISEFWERKLIGLNCDKNKIMVHRMGIKSEKFAYSERKIRSEEPIRMLTIGRLAEKKGYEYAIRAAAKVIKENNNVMYMIGGDGPLRNELETMVSELGIANHVKFFGAIEQEEVLALYNQAHFFVLASVTANDGDQEGIPVVLMEAQSVGLPVVSTYHSGIPEGVINGKSGFLVPEKDVDALAEKIKYLIEHPELWPDMGRQGRKLVEEKFNINILNQQLSEIFHTLS